MLDQIGQYLSRNFAMIFFGSLVTGLIFQTASAMIHPFMLYLLMAAVYLNFLKVDFAVIKKELKNWPYQMYLLLYSLVIIPAAGFYLAAAAADVFGLKPEWALGALLLFGSPTGAVVPTLNLLMNGRVERTLLNLITTAIVVPLTLPLLVSLLAGQTIGFDPMAMSLFLAQLIIVPLVSALATKKLSPGFVINIQPHVAPLSIIPLSLVIVGAVAGLRGQIVDHPVLLFEILSVSTALFLFIFTASWFLSFKQDASDKVCLSSLATWTNIGLAIVVASEFFGQTMPRVVLFVTICEIPWNAGFLPAKWFAARVTGKRR